MSDLEERPSKIRKLDPQEDKSKLALSSPVVPEPSGKSEAENTSDQKKSENEDAMDRKIPGGDSKVPPLSKSQLKKLRRQEQWEARIEYRRAKRREKQKAKKVRKAEERADLETKIANGEVPVPEPAKKSGPARPIQLPVAFILDCDFDGFMNEKELISLGAQITRCYSENKSMPYRSHMAISSWGGQLKDRFEKALSNHHLGWKGVRFIEGDFVAAAKEVDQIMREPYKGRLAGAFASPEISESTSQTTTSEDQDSSTAERNSEPAIVYLTSDSPHTLERLSPNTSYIIGGIVDKNRHKGLCYKRACERDIATAKLPIGQYMTMQGRSVLAVNHVMEIMLHWLESGDWGDAFVKVIPKRKEAKLRAKAGQKVSEISEEIEDDDEDESQDGSDDEDDGKNIVEGSREGGPGEITIKDSSVLNGTASREPETGPDAGNCDGIKQMEDPPSMK